MTEQEVHRIKDNLLNILDTEITTQKEKLSILKSYRLELEKAETPEVITKLHKEIILLNLIK